MSCKNKNNSFPCPHNEAAVCWYKEKPCGTCGWNPTVARARLKRYCSIHKIEVPEPKKEIQPTK